MTSQATRTATILSLPVKRWPGRVYRFLRALRFTAWRTLGFAIGVFLVVAVLVTRHNLNRALPELAQNLQRATGLQVTIEGSLVPQLRWQPTLALDDLYLGRKEDWPEAELIHIARIEVSTLWRDLLRGDPRIHDVRIAGVTAKMPGAKTDDTREDHNVAPSGGSGGTGGMGLDTSALRYLEISDISIELPVEEESSQASEPVNVQSLSFNRTPGTDGPITLALRSAFREHPLALSGQVGRLEQWLHSKPIQIDLTGTLAWARVTATGQIGDPLNIGDINVAVTLDSESAPALGVVGGYQIPADTPLAVRARLVSDEPYINVEDLRLLVGGIHLQQSGKQ